MKRSTQQDDLDRRARARLLKMRGPKRHPRSWRDIGEQIGVNPGFLSSIASGKARASNSVLKALRLPLRAVLAVPCRSCGEVHLRHVCPKIRQRRALRRIADMPTPVLAFKIKHREEIK